MAATVLITRPLAQGRAFAAALEDAHGGPVQTVISPLIETAPVVVDQDFAEVAHILFTSVNGVAQADRLGLPKSATAWCVGGRTAEKAASVGFDTRTAGGDSKKLVALIVAANVTGRMVHIRGRHTAGDIVGGLSDVGLTCEPVVAYDQVAIAPTQDALDLLSGEKPVIVPLFSPRTAKLFSQIDAFHAPLHFVMMSDSIVISEELVPVCSIDIADIDTMIDGTLTGYRRFSP